MSLEVRPLRALASPIRLRILSLLTASPMSATDVARELDIAHASASYHLRQLHAAELIDVVEERTVRGGRERLYRHDPMRGDTMGGEQARFFHAAMVDELQRRLRLATKRQPSHFADAELWVSDDVWAHVVEQIREAVILLHEKAEPPHTKGASKVSTTVALFRMADS